MNSTNPDLDPGHQKRLVLAVVLSTVIMGLYYYFYQMPLALQREEYKNKMRIEQEFAKANASIAPVQNGVITAAPASDVMLPGEKVEGTNDGASAPSATVTKSPLETREELIKSSPRVKINNGRLHGSVRLLGARLDDVTLVNYREEIAKNSPEVALMSPKGTEQSNFVDIGWIASDGKTTVPNADSLWKVEEGVELTAKTPVTISWENGQGQKFFITYKLDEDFMFSVDQRVENKSNADIKLLPYGLISKSQRIEAENFILHTGPLGVMDGTLTEVSYDDLRETPEQSFEKATGWIGITDKYWFKSLIPQKGEEYKASFRAAINDGTERFQIDYLGQERIVKVGETATYNAMVFAGAKELNLLASYSEKYQVPLFERSIDFGWFHFLTKPMYYALIKFYGLLGNFGLSILLLTFCVKLCLFPLARKGYISMGKLKQLHPKIVELQKRHKEDKMAMQKSMMELYKKEKVNPAAGCLPILLQIPIFFSLYKVFFVSIEMRHAPFYGWIEDLSAKDPTSIFNLFGILPFESPAFIPSMLAVGFLPCLMAVTMYIQQQLSPPVSDPMTAKMMKMMPFIFLFVLGSFPSGLVIYWIFSNILTIAQQLYFLKNYQIKTKV